MLYRIVFNVCFTACLRVSDKLPGLPVWVDTGFLYFRRVFAKEFFKMENRFKLFGIVVLLAVIGFSMAACDGGSSSKFEGRWLRDFAINHSTYTDYSFTFTGDTFVFKMVEGRTTVTFNGTFTYTDSVISFSSETVKWQTSYTLNGKNLALASGPSAYSFIAGTYVKQ